jgi:hypothetical protein
VTIDDEVVIGHGVMLVNDRNLSVLVPIAGTWTKARARVERGPTSAAVP